METKTIENKIIVWLDINGLKNEFGDAYVKEIHHLIDLLKKEKVVCINSVIRPFVSFEFIENTSAEVKIEWKEKDDVKN